MRRLFRPEACGLIILGSLQQHHGASCGGASCGGATPSVIIMGPCLAPECGAVQASLGPFLKSFRPIGVPHQFAVLCASKLTTRQFSRISVADPGDF
jgi:hypothetical protein